MLQSPRAASRPESPLGSERSMAWDGNGGMDASFANCFEKHRRAVGQALERRSVQPPPSIHSRVECHDDSSRVERAEFTASAAARSSSNFCAGASSLHRGVTDVPVSILRACCAGERVRIKVCGAGRANGGGGRGRVVQHTGARNLAGRSNHRLSREESRALGLPPRAAGWGRACSGAAKRGHGGLAAFAARLFPFVLVR